MPNTTKTNEARIAKIRQLAAEVALLTAHYEGGKAARELFDAVAEILYQGADFVDDYTDSCHKLSDDLCECAEALTSAGEE